MLHGNVVNFGEHVRKDVKVFGIGLCTRLSACVHVPPSGRQFPIQLELALIHDVNCVSQVTCRVDDLLLIETLLFHKVVKLL